MVIAIVLAAGTAGAVDEGRCPDRSDADRRTAGTDTADSADAGRTAANAVGSVEGRQVVEMA